MSNTFEVNYKSPVTLFTTNFIFHFGFGYILMFDTLWYENFKNKIP